MEQPYVQPPQFVMMPVPQRNGLGVFGFFVSLIGLIIPTGLVALLGFVLSLAAVGRALRGFATSGVILGLLGTVIWACIMIAALVVGVVGAVAVAVVGAAGFMLVQPEVVEITSDMVNVAIAATEYQEENDEMPEELAALTLGVATMTDPWGKTYRFTLVDDEPGFDVVSAGADGRFDTDDDVRLSRLDRLWEEAFEGFDQKMEELGERMERLDGFQYSSACCEDDTPPRPRVVTAGPRNYAADYETAAVEAIEGTDEDEPVEAKAAEPDEH